MADVTGNIIQWKKLWQLISGIHFDTPNQTVLDRLTDVSQELINGLKKPATPSAQSVKDVKEKCPERLTPFIENLQQFLNIDAVQAWDLLCYYLVNEYRGSANSLTNYLSTETNMLKLLNDVWKFYALERMIMLKIVKNLLEFYLSTTHPYSKEYQTVLKQMKFSILRKSYIDQLEHLVKDVPTAQFNVNECFNTRAKMVLWSERKLRETVEVLQIIFLIVENDGILPVEFKKLIELFRLHSFGRQQQYLDPGNRLHNDLIQKITYSEIALFLKCTDCSKKTNILWIEEATALLDSHIVTLHQNVEYGPLLLAWMLLNFNKPNIIEDEVSRKYQQFGTKAVQLGVFDYLHKMMCHTMYRDQSVSARVCRRTVYNHLTHLCDIFDADGSVAQHAKIYDLLAEILKTPSIAKDFIANEDTGVRSLYNTALENFPIDFRSLSLIADALASTGSAQHSYIRQQLEALPVYTEYYNSESVALRSSGSTDEFCLIADYCPFKKINFVIPAGTSVVLVDNRCSTTIHFRTKLNYFDVLHNEINELLADTLKYMEVDEGRKQNVVDGLKYLSWAVRRARDPNEISSEMVHPTEMVFDILMKFKNVQQPPIELLARCFEVCAGLLPLFAHEIYRRIINLNILPFVTNESLDFKAYSNGVSFESGLVGYYMINFEKNMGKYDFLLAYLNFLKTYTKLGLSGHGTSSIELPSLVFMLREIFPHVHSWRFENETDRLQIFSMVMQYFFDILQLTADQLKDDKEKTLLRNTCVYSLLNLDNGMSLLRFVAIGNDHLQLTMQNESNWMTASHSGLNMVVQLSMTILMQILRLRNKVIVDPDTLSPLESIIYTQPKQRDNLRIIPVVTSYMGNIFNFRLPLLACRLLRRFAIEFQMSLLACLDMEPDQIRLTFLQRLRNDLETDFLKIAVVEFVEACINKQPGLTEAFFKISYEHEKRFLGKLSKSKEISDGILTYMTEYLETIAADPVKSISSPLLCRIMSLFHALWKNNMQSLVQKLLDKPSFWPDIMMPLFSRLNKESRVYSQLFNMLGIELFRCSEQTELDENLRKSLNFFFEKETFSRWVDCVLTLPEETIDDQVTDEPPEWLCRLQSFKDFFIIFIRKSNHSVEMSDSSKKYFADKCLAVLVERCEYIDDFRPFIILSELYLMLLLSFKHKYTENVAEDEDMLQKISKLLNGLSNSYREIHCRAKESVLTIAFKSIDLLSNELLKNHSISSDFIRSIIEIICFEITETAHKPAGDEQNLPFILSLNLLKKIILNLSNNFANWKSHFLSSKILNRLLDCLGGNLQKHNSRKIVVEMLELLIVFARGVYSEELIHCSVSDYLWLSLLPPKELLASLNTTIAGPAAQNLPKTWHTNDWWPIYRRGIELVTILLQTHKHWFLKDALMFVGVHEEYLMDSILLGKQTLDADAMTLIKTTLELVAEMIKYNREWRLEHPQSMISLMRCVQVMMDHAVSLLYRPKILKRLVDGTNNMISSPAAIMVDSFATDTQSVAPTEEIIKALNDLIEIVIICAKCLLAFSPTFMNLVVETEFTPAQWQPLVEIQFGAPKLNGNPQLTFGTVLSAAGIFTKALHLQHYSFHEVPLNSMNAEGDTTLDMSSSMGRTFSDSTIQRITGTTTKRNSSQLSGSTAGQISSTRSLFSKSISMSSAASTTIQSNEILLNLDDKLCVQALEFVLTLLGSQSLLALKDVNLSSREKQLIKRELSTELSTFHDFVKKRILVESKGPLYRKKRPTISLNPNGESSRNRVVVTPTSEKAGSSVRNSMRVNVIRKLHLHTQQTPSPPSSSAQKRLSTDEREMTTPVGLMTPSKNSALNLPSSTPFEQKSPATEQQRKRVSFDEPSKYATPQMDAPEMQYFNPEEPTYSGLSKVQIVEEDYLHFLSNLFTHICQNE